MCMGQDLVAIFFYSYLITQLLAGPLLDKYSPRTLTAFAIALSGLGSMAFAHANTLLEASAARGAIGVGAAFATVSYLKLTAIWFKPQQYAFVSGLLATAVMVGSMTGQAPLAFLVSHHGWREALNNCGLLGLGVAACYYLFVRDGNKNKKSAITVSKISPKNYFVLLKNRSNWLLMFYSGLAFSPLAVFGGLWGNPFLQEAYHLSSTDSGALVSLAFLGLGIGAPLFGILSDKLKNRYLFMKTGLAVSLLGLLFSIYMPQQASIYWVGTALFVFGFGTGAFMIGFVVGKELNHIALAATVVGLINTGDAIFGALTEPLVGKALDIFATSTVGHSTHSFSLTSYHIAMGILPLYLFAASVFLWQLAKKSKT